MTALITREGLARLDAALAWIDEHPEQHDQGSWVSRRPDCGTTCCVAGAVVILAGGVPIWDDGDLDAYMVTMPGGDGNQVIESVAMELLGIGFPVVEDLFYHATTLQGLRAVRDRLAASLESTP